MHSNDLITDEDFVSFIMADVIAERVLNHIQEEIKDVIPSKKNDLEFKNIVYNAIISELKK